MTARRAGILAAAAICAAALVDGSEVASPAELAGEKLATPVFSFSEAVFTPGDVVVENSKLVEFDEKWCDHGCQGASAGDAVGVNMTLVQLSYSEVCFHCGYAWIAQVAESVGAAATLFYSDETAGHEFRVIHDKKKWQEAEGLPFFELASADAERLRPFLRDGDEVLVNVIVTSNPWRDLFDGPAWIFVQIMCSLMALYVLALASARLSKFATWYIREGAYKVAVWILAIEVFCNLVRFLYAAIDPLWSRSVFPYGVGRFMLTLTIPIGLLSSVMLFLAWNDMLKASHTPNRSLLFHRRSSRAIFFIVCVIFVGFELTLSLLAVFQGLVALSETAAIAEAAFTLIVAVAVMVVGWRLLRTLGNGPQSRTGVSKTSKASKALASSPSSKDGSKNSHFPPASPRPLTVSSLEPAVSPLDDEEDLELAAPESSRDEKVATNPRSTVSRTRAETGGSKAKPRTRQTSNLRRLTWKIMFTAIGLIASALVIALAGQSVVLFTPAARAVFFTLFYASQTARSYFTVSFFDPRRR